MRYNVLKLVNITSSGDFYCENGSSANYNSGEADIYQCGNGGDVNFGATACFNGPGDFHGSADGTLYDCSSGNTVFVTKEAPFTLPEDPCSNGGHG